MRTIRRTLLEIVAFSILALLVGFGLNATRGRNSIQLTRDYFPPSVAKASVPVDTGTPAPCEDLGDSTDKAPIGFGGPPSADSEPTASPQTKKSHGIEHEFQELDFEKIKEIFEDPDTQLGLNIFVDARSDDHYAESHIPGAIQCDRYRLAEYIDEVLMAAEMADKVIVYCTGGECEDSVLLCRDLVEASVEYEKLYLYAGGCAEWVEKNMPCHRGMEP